MPFSAPNTLAFESKPWRNRVRVTFPEPENITPAPFIVKQLQALGTAPAIDYEAYLTRFQREDGAT